MTSDGRISIVQDATAALRQISRAAWLVGLAATTASGVINFTIWSQHRKFGWSDAAPAALVAAVWLAAVYLAIMAIVARMPSLAGFVRFVLASVFGFTPVVLAFAILLAAKPWLNPGSRIVILLVAVLVQLAFTAMLPAWAVAQALSAKIVSPLRVLRATRGHRWSLVLAAFVIGGLNNDTVVPKMATATSAVTAAAIALGGIMMGVLTIGFSAAIAATAWRFAVRNDPGLA